MDPAKGAQRMLSEEVTLELILNDSMKRNRNSISGKGIAVEEQ
jgi:hypothetical protein